jgi:hypothetical protein
MSGTDALFRHPVIQLKKVNEENRNSECQIRLANSVAWSNRCTNSVQRGTAYECDCPTYRLQPDARISQRGRRTVCHADGVGCRKDIVEGAPQSASRTKVAKS